MTRGHPTWIGNVVPGFYYCPKRARGADPSLDGAGGTALVGGP